MTNQMKIILKVGLFASLGAFILSLVALLVGGIGYLHPFSYVVLGFSALAMVVFFVMYLNMKSNERTFKQQIAYFKLLQELRNKAILDFYNKFGIKPQYNKDGKLLTPDEFLGIITALDAEGKLDPSIYEKLGILPRFDENGKEIPTILVLKHLIRAVKKQGITDIKKLKGLYAKGTRVQAPAKKEAKAKGKGDKDKGKAKAKDKKKGKVLKASGREVRRFSKKKGPEKKKPQAKNKGGKEEAKKPAEKASTPPKAPPAPKVEKVTQADMNKIGDDYFKGIEKPTQQPTKPVRPRPPISHTLESEIGECTPE